MPSFLASSVFVVLSLAIASRTFRIFFRTLLFKREQADQFLELHVLAAELGHLQAAGAGIVRLSLEPEVNRVARHAVLYRRLRDLHAVLNVFEDGLLHDHINVLCHTPDIFPPHWEVCLVYGVHSIPVAVSKLETSPPVKAMMRSSLRMTYGAS